MYFRIWRHLTRGDCEALQSKSRYRLGIYWYLLAFNFVQFLWTCNKKSQLCKYKIECNMVVNLDAVRCHVSMILTCQRFEEAVFRFCLLFRKMRLHLKTKMMQWLYWIYILSSSTQTPLEECMKMRIIQWLACLYLFLVEFWWNFLFWCKTVNIFQENIFLQILYKNMSLF